MNQKLSYFRKNIYLFSIANFVPKLLQFVLVPLYTNYLTPAEYGTADLIFVTVSLLVPVFTLGIQDAVLRFALDDSYKKEDVFSVAVKTVFGGFLVLCGLLCAGIWLNMDALHNQYLHYFLLLYLATAAYNSISLFCRGSDRVEILVEAGIINSLVTLTCNILLLTVFRRGLEGFLQANIAGTMVSLLYCVIKARLHRYLRFSTPWKVYREMYLFSIPLIANVIAWWINSALDRYMLTWIVGLEVSGIYAVSYKIPNILSVFQGIFFQAWTLSAVKEFDREDTDGFFSGVYSLSSFAMVFVCSGIMIMTVPLAKLLYAKEFFAAWQYSIPLLVSFVFNAVSLFFGSIFTAVKDSRILAISTVAGASVNVVANVLLIPSFAAYGAAIATLLGYMVVWLIRFRGLKKYINLKTDSRREILSYGLLLCQMVIGSFGAKAIPGQILVMLCILMLYRKEATTLVSKVRNKIPHR